MHSFALHSKHVSQNVYKIVQAPEVAILPVPLHPRAAVVQHKRRRHRHGLSKVDHPHAGSAALVMNEQQ